jgi:transcriptional regulator with XRE-family HTH domain
MTTTTIPEWTLHDRLHKAREFAGLTQGQLADRLECGEKTVWRAENTDAPIKRGTVLAWAVACGVDPAWLLTGEVIEGADTQAVTLCTSRDCDTVWVTQMPGQLSLAVAA